jgi:hypothetical protein
MGLPADWSVVMAWLNPEVTCQLPPAVPPPPLVKKCPEVPTLANYKVKPGPEFWKAFPQASLSTSVSTRVRVDILKARVAAMTGKWTRHQMARGARAIRNLEEGAEAFQKRPLPALSVPNAESAYTHGELITDSIATWVKAGILAGPFMSPPLPHFRANSICAIDQKDKVRLVLDMSRPKGRSFNDNISKRHVGRISMATAQSFSYKLLEAGKAAVMSKQDMKDAYKLIPAKAEDRRLQGMRWCGAYFVEEKMTFGSTASPYNYDVLSATVKDLAVSDCSIPSHWVQRCLDDVPSVAPASTTWNQEFSTSYSNICKDLGIPLAAPCPRNEKAFLNQTEGRVLGIWFDSKSLCWSYPGDKAVPLIRDINDILMSRVSGLRQFQKALGSINDVAQLCPFLKGFRKPANDFMASFLEDTEVLLQVPPQVSRDLQTCQKVIAAAWERLPIAARPADPPCNHLLFTSDAAGAVMGTVQGARMAMPSPCYRGVASVSLDEDLQPVFVCRLIWPLDFLNHARDSKGALFGAKSTTLEMVGLLLPFLTIPDMLAGKQVVLQVDNIAALFGWEDKQVKGDITASILIRALHLIEAFLACTIHVTHLPRMSSDAGRLADHLSREETTSEDEERVARRVEVSLTSTALLSWLKNPQEDWQLARDILQDVMLLCSHH